MSVFLDFLLISSYIIFPILGCFIFWSLMYGQGFRNDRIWDFMVLLAITALISGRIFYLISAQEIPRLTFLGLLGPPYMVSGVLLASIFVISSLCGIYNWSVYRVGDYLGVALSLVFGGILLTRELILFSGDSTVNWVYFSLGAFYLGLFIYSFQRLKTQIFAGFIFIQFLMAASIAEIIADTVLYGFSYFPQLTYSAIIVFAISNLYSRLKEVNIMKADLSPDFLEKMKKKLGRRKEELEAEISDVSEADPFSDESRVEFNADESLEADELEGHSDAEASKNLLQSLSEQVKKALNRMQSGKYGECEVCGKPIEKKRLEANPAATTCVEHQ